MKICLLINLNRFTSFVSSGFLLALFCLSCAEKTDTGDAIVIGDLRDQNSFLEGKWIYLGNVGTRKFEDSTVVKNGKFRLSVRAGKSFTPFRVSILYRTRKPEKPYQLIGFKNPVLAKTVEVDFYADRGTTTFGKNPEPHLIGEEKIQFVLDRFNKQTEVILRHPSFKGGQYMSENDKKSNIALVKKYSYSVDLLGQLNLNKQNMSEADLKYLVDLFDAPLKSNPAYQNIQQYLAYDNQSGTIFPAEVTLKRPDKSLSADVIDKNSKYNLVIFWASWCGPCRGEIPQIKALHSKHNKDINISSVSIDKDEEAWQIAMGKENMPWNQFLVDDRLSFSKLDKKYDLNSIPLWLLFDSSNNLIHKQYGMFEGKEAIDKKIESLIAAK